MSSIANEKDNLISKEDEEQDITSITSSYTTCAEIDKCANCGKEGSNLNICNKCREAKYCNATCKKKHRSKHKKKCERRAAESQAELHEEQLFKQPPPKEDCPICFLPLPSLDTGSKYKICCGKYICSGCIHAVAIRDKEKKCPFCRTPTPDSDEIIERYKKRVKAGDANAMFNLGCCYSNGSRGLPQNYLKAMELWQQAGELGHAKAYNNVGNAYHFGEGVERDEKKADHYFELAAIGGDVTARYNLGNAEWHAGNWDRSIKHYMIAAGVGLNNSAKNIQQLYRDGHATKEDYAKALRAYQAYLEDMRSEQRDQAAAYNDRYKCY